MNQWYTYYTVVMRHNKYKKGVKNENNNNHNNNNHNDNRFFYVQKFSKYSQQL